MQTWFYPGLKWTFLLRLVVSEEEEYWKLGNNWPKGKSRAVLSEHSAVNDLQAKPQVNIDGLTKVAAPFYFSHKKLECILYQ